MPSEIHRKMERADILAERQIFRDEENQLRERLRNEKAELPSLVSQCLDWARINSLKRLAQADVDTFILEKDLDILKETKKAL